MMNLYEINEQILGCIDLETGEIIDEEMLNELNMAFSDKVEGIACWIKNLLSDAEQLKAEEKKLKERRQVEENKAERLKNVLVKYLNGEKFSTPKVAISFRKSESVDVSDINALMHYDDCDQYLKYKDPEPDKTAIKAAIKSGVKLPGCALVESKNIQIK